MSTDVTLKTNLVRFWDWMTWRIAYWEGVVLTGLLYTGIFLLVIYLSMGMYQSFMSEQLRLEFRDACLEKSDLSELQCHLISQQSPDWDSMTRAFIHE